VLFVVAVAAAPVNRANSALTPKFDKEGKPEELYCFQEARYVDRYTYEWNSALDPRSDAWIFNTWWNDGSTVVDAIGEGLFDDHENGAFMFYAYYAQTRWVNFFYAIWNPFDTPSNAAHVVSFIADGISAKYFVDPYMSTLVGCTSKEDVMHKAQAIAAQRMQGVQPHTQPRTQEAPNPAKKATAPGSHCFVDGRFPGDMYTITWNSTADPSAPIWMYELMWASATARGVGKGLYDSAPTSGTFQGYGVQGNLLSLYYARWSPESMEAEEASGVISWTIDISKQTMLHVPYTTYLKTCTTGYEATGASKFADK